MVKRKQPRRRRAPAREVNVEIPRSQPVAAETVSAPSEPADVHVAVDAGDVGDVASGSEEAFQRARDATQDPAPDAPPQAPPQPPPPMGAEGLLLFMQLANAGTVQAAAKFQGVPLTPEELIELSRFTDAERQLYTMLAPYAAPSMQRVLDALPRVAPFLFFGLWSLSLLARLVEIKSRARAIAEEKKAQEARNGAHSMPGAAAAHG